MLRILGNGSSETASVPVLKSQISRAFGLMVIQGSFCNKPTVLAPAACPEYRSSHAPRSHIVIRAAPFEKFPGGFRSGPPGLVPELPRTVQSNPHTATF